MNSTLVVASNAGSARNPAWLLNLAKHPDQVWLTQGRRRIKVAPLLGKVDCPCCGRRRFEWLEGEQGSQTTSLCGRNAVQVAHRLPAKLNFEEMARHLAEARVDLAFCAGPLMKSLWDALPPTRRGGYAETAEALAPLVARAAEPGDVVMVKGSNGSKAGLIAQALGQLDVRPGEAG